MSGSDQEELFDEDPREAAAYLAEQCGLPVQAFVETFGAGWQPMPVQLHDYDADPEGVGEILGLWSVAGEPFQICLRPVEGGVELGMPVGHWVGHEMSWQVRRRELVAEEAVDGRAASEAVARLLKARRSTFHYCRYCRVLTPPELRLDVDTCYGCASTWQGVVY